MMKRIALGECRCERATSPGIRTCTAAMSVLVVAHWSFRPGLKSCIARRSSPTGTAVHDCSTTRSSSDHFHRCGIASGRGCGVIWLAISHSPYMWFSWISLWKASAWRIGAFMAGSWPPILLVRGADLGPGGVVRFEQAQRGPVTARSGDPQRHLRRQQLREAGHRQQVHAGQDGLHERLLVEQPEREHQGAQPDRGEHRRRLARQGRLGEIEAIAADELRLVRAEMVRRLALVYERSGQRSHAPRQPYLEGDDGGEIGP